MKKLLQTIIVLILTLVCCISFAACGEVTHEQLKNDYGILIEGGGFKDGSKLVSEVIALTSEEGKAALEAIKNQEYNEDGGKYIFDISVSLDGVEVQPDGKVKVTLPVPNEEVSKYDVFHIKDDNTSEKLAATYSDGKVSFETDGFSLFVLVEAKTYVFLAQCETSGGGYITENNQTVDFGNGRKVEDGTQITLTAVANSDYTFVGWGTRDSEWNLTIISSDATHTFTVSETVVDEYGKYYVQAVFEEKPVGLKVDAHNAGFTYDNGELTKTVYVIGNENKPDIERVLVYATYSSQEAQDKCLTLDVDYIRELGGLDLTKAGTYTVTYKYKADTSITVSLTVEVVAE